MALESLWLAYWHSHAGELSDLSADSQDDAWRVVRRLSSAIDGQSGQSARRRAVARQPGDIVVSVGAEAEREAARLVRGRVRVLSTSRGLRGVACTVGALDLSGLRVLLQQIHRPTDVWIVAEDGRVLFGLPHGPHGPYLVRAPEDESIPD